MINTSRYASTVLPVALLLGFQASVVEAQVPSAPQLGVFVYRRGHRRRGRDRRRGRRPARTPMAKKKQKEPAKQAEQQAQVQQASTRETLNKAYGACLEGKGYTVK